MPSTSSSVQLLLLPVYGMSLVYLWSGDLDFDALAASWAAMDGPFAVIGVGLMLVAFGFKVGAAFTILLHLMHMLEPHHQLQVC